MMNSVIEGRICVLNSEQDDLKTALVSVLLVDDFEPCRNMVALILKEESGYEIVGQAADGLEAVQKAEEFKPDLVVLDIGLPEINGIEVARRIRRCSPDSTILFLSGNSDPEVAREALRTGARGYLHKFDLVLELAAAAKTVLSGKQFVSRRLRNRDLSENS
jgi:DNA-binding NarL/FixJ family response regulator